MTKTEAIVDTRVAIIEPAKRHLLEMQWRYVRHSTRVCAPIAKLYYSHD